MLKHFAVGASALALTTVLALAQTASPPAGSTMGTAPATTGATSPRSTVPATDAARLSSDFQAIQGAAVSLAQAIGTAEGQANGRAISAEFEARDANEPAHYDVKVVHADGKLIEHEIDATTGRIISSENQPFERYFTRLKPADFQNARLSLREAIAMAEQRAGAGARALEAEVDRESSNVVYEIEIASAERSQELTIDGNGQVVERD